MPLLSCKLFHFGNENYGGARKLYDSSRKYLQPYAPNYEGMDVEKLLRDHAVCFEELLSCRETYPTNVFLNEDLLPRIESPSEV